MNQKKFLGSVMLLIAAIVWGGGFVAQSVAADSVPPLTFNAIRFFIGGLVLLPFIAVQNRKKSTACQNADNPEKNGGANGRKFLLIGGALCGVVLFLSSALQQIGIDKGTDPGRAGFITALYILLVPIFGIFLGQRPRVMTWVCATLGLIGLYLLCIPGHFSPDPDSGVSTVAQFLRFLAGDIAASDLFVLGCAVMFSFHILIVDRVSPRVDGVKLSCIQFFVSGLCALIPALFLETVTMQAILGAWVSLLYAGVMSCGIAYTLQVLGQKYTPPTVASLLLSLESVFAVLAGILILHEVPSLREGIGCLVMFVAILLAQLPQKKKRAA